MLFLRGEDIASSGAILATRPHRVASFSRFFSHARRRTRDAVPADINYCGPASSRPGARAKNPPVPIRNYKRCRSTQLRTTSPTSILSFFPSLVRLRVPSRGFLSFSSSSSLDQPGEPADRTCHWSSFHPRHAHLSTPVDRSNFLSRPPYLLLFPSFFPSLSLSLRLFIRSDDDEDDPFLFCLCLRLGDSLRPRVPRKISIEHRDTSRPK